jgi:vacuolar protein-sorting-associated protein 4
MTKEALMEPIRTLQDATHFRKVSNPAKPNDPQAYLYEPCSYNDPQAEQLSLMQIPSERLKTMDVTFLDFMRCLNKTKATVAEADLAKFDDWTREFGSSGE